jgi:hypothetical protein
MQFATEPRIADVAASLMAAWESGDARRLESAVERAASELGAGDQASPYASELRELLLGVVEGLHGLLGASQPADFRTGRQGAACYDLLRHAQGSASAAAAGPQA